MKSLRNINLIASSFLIVFLVVVQMEVGSADEYHRVPLHTARSNHQQNRAEKEGFYRIDQEYFNRAYSFYIFAIFKITTDAVYWKASAQALLQAELDKKPIETQAKNIIFFLGDGLFLFSFEKH